MTDKELDVAAKRAKALLPDRAAYLAAMNKVLDRLMNENGQPESMARVAFDLAAGNPTE